MIDIKIEDDLRQLRYLVQAVSLITNQLEDDYEGEALTGIVTEMCDRIESLERQLFKKPTGKPKLTAVS